MMYRQLTSAKRSSLRNVVLATTSLSIWVMASSVALAGAPATGSLPGSFSTNIAGTTYKGTGSTATIDIGGNSTPVVDSTPSVIQFGGTALGNSVTSVDTNSTTGAALAAASNPGFSIGSGATLKLTGGGTSPTLINDESGNPSQIYGALDASGLGGTLFVANANGVVVGATGVIDTTTNNGADLLGYSVDSNSFINNKALTVNSSTIGTGDVTVTAGSTVSGGTLLVAGNGAVNVGIGGPVDVIAGYGFTVGFTSAPPLLTVSTALPNSTASVNFSGGSTATPIDVLAINAVGAVNNSGILTLPATGIGGTFTNSGVVNVAGLTAGAISNAGMINDTAGTLTAVGVAGATSGADITNTGVINEAYTSLTLTAGASTSVNPSNVPGNFSNTGVINFTTAAAAGTNALVVHAQNINMAGSIQATPTGATAAAPLSSTNYLNNIYLEGGYRLGSATSAYTGVVDVSSSIYSNYAQIDAGAARILTGGLYGAGTTNYTTINLGNGQFTDPFTNTTLSYNLSLFPKTTVDAGEVNVYGGQPTGSPKSTSMAVSRRAHQTRISTWMAF
ncbi:MAG: hypothetical protein B7Z67_13925 [Acidiphilium sp. 21-60-14]|nr:MAG: hypothetical protein B7Z67_13925 [Acidiphilium sp. 21-60-14]